LYWENYRPLQGIIDMRLTVKQLKRIIKEAVMDASRDESMSMERANEIFDALDTLHEELNEESILMPWPTVIKEMKKRGVETSKEEIMDFIKTFKDSSSSLGADLARWLKTNKPKEQGLGIYDPSSPRASL